MEAKEARVVTGPVPMREELGFRKGEKKRKGREKREGVSQTIIAALRGSGLGMMLKLLSHLTPDVKAHCPSMDTP